MEGFKMPHLDKVVGMPKEYSHKQSELEEFFANKFKEGGKFGKNELKKTEKDMKIINFTQNAVDDYLERYKRKKKVIIPPENIHILEEGGTKKITRKFETGAHSTEYGDLLVDRAQRDVDFSLTLFHELLHAKSFTAMQITTGSTKEERKIEPYRSGFSVTSRDGRKTYFDGVNEAIVGFLTKRFFEEYIMKSELFKDEVQKMKGENVSIDTSREKEMQAGLEFINKIYELNKDKYSLKEIMNIFIDAGISGNLLKVARLVERTFGKGSFRKLGEEKSKIEV